MKKKSLYILIAQFLLLGTSLPIMAEWRDIKLDLTDFNLLEEGEKEQWAIIEPFGIVVADDGTISRTNTNLNLANAKVSGRFHSAQHGWMYFSATVPEVDGKVRITFGACFFSPDNSITIKDSKGDTISVINAYAETVSAFSNNDAETCFDYIKKDKNFVSVYLNLKHSETLTISSKGYVPYFAIEKTNELPVKIVYNTGGAIGCVPPDVFTFTGREYTLPMEKNRTLYMEGKTFSGRWYDTANEQSYIAGQTITIPEVRIMNLLPVFTDNVVALYDRISDVMLKYDFHEEYDAPIVSWQREDGHVWVTQAEVDGETIDVKADISTKNGKFSEPANGWCQINDGTIMTVPSCMGAVITVSAFDYLGVGDNPLTIDGVSDYVYINDDNKTVSYTVIDDDTTAEIVFGSDGRYYRSIQVLLPFKNAVAQTMELTSLPTITYGDSAYTLPVMTNEGQALVWTSSNSQVVSISDNRLTIKKAGTVVITATQEGSQDYLPFSREFTLTINKAPLTISAGNYNKVEGEDNPTFTPTFSGFKNGETKSVLTKQPTITTTATKTSPAGSYPVTVNGAEANNYSIGYKNGRLTVTAASAPNGNVELEPLEEDDKVDFSDEGGDIDEETDLTSVVVDNLYYNIGVGDGGYSTEDGCIIITKETSNEQMEALEGLGITDEELKQNFTGIIFKVPAGSGKVAVTAETSGNMTLKVKVGNGLPMEMELSGRLKINVPYNVTEDTYIYIFAGTQNAARGLKRTSGDQSLKIYGVELETTLVKGDANGDKKVNDADVTEVANHLVGKTSANFVTEGADINSDGVVNIVDQVLIIKRSLRKR